MNENSKIFGIDQSEILAQILQEKTLGESSVSQEKLEIEADLAMTWGKKKKGKEDLIGSSLMMGKIKAMIARSFTNKSPINIRSTQNGNERIAKAQNKVYNEDRDTAEVKSIRLYKDIDKFTQWIWIIAREGWNGKKKSNKWLRINPLLSVPDPYWDYMLNDYRYIGFYDMMSGQDMKDKGYDTSWCQDASKWAKERKQKEQIGNGIQPQWDKDIFDTYIHFTNIEGKLAYFLVNGSCTHILEWKSIDKMPFVFYYWFPNGSFFGDRPANYLRDSQKWIAEMRNLQADKVRQEVYVQWLYNSDYVSWKDIGFWMNKKIPIKTWLDGANVPLSNVVFPIQKDVRIDATNWFIQELNEEITMATSIWPVAQGSTTDRREALGTNKLVQDNTDINLSLNEEIDAIGEMTFTNLWYDGYYVNFSEADKKLIYAGSSTGMSPVILERKDFIIEGNLSIEVETSKVKAERQIKENAWRTQNSPLILQDPSINDSSKRIVLRKLLLSWWAEIEDIEEEIPHTAQYLLQQQENAILKTTYIGINPTDNHAEHLVSMWDIDPDDINMITHQAAHIQAEIESSQQQVEQWPNQMLNGAMSQAMSQAWSQTAKLNSNPQ